MSRCFIKFPIRGFRRTQYITSIGLIYKNVGKLGRGILRGITLEIFSFIYILNNLEKQ